MKDIGKSFRSMLDNYDVDNYDNNSLDVMLDRCIDSVKEVGIVVDCINFYNEMLDKVDELLFDVYINDYNDLEVGKKVVELFSNYKV